MSDPSHPAALITGASTGIGKHVALHLADLGYDLTLLDVNVQALSETAAAARGRGVQVAEIKCDVCDLGAQLAAFRRHVAQFGRLDLAILNAGIAEQAVQFYMSQLEDWAWDKVLDIDLRAVIGGAQIASRVMEESGSKGCILCVASAAGIFPVPVTPIYSTAKAGVVHFVRSVAPKLAKKGITTYAICPQFVDTAMGRMVVDSANSSAAREALLGVKGDMLSTQQVVDLMMDAVEGKYQTGAALLLLQTGQIVEPFKRRPPPAAAAAAAAAAAQKPQGSQGKLGLQVTPGVRDALAAWVRHTPSHYSQILVRRLSPDFTAATQITRSPLAAAAPPPAGQALLRHVCAGINASDINYSSGRYHKSRAEAERALPFPAGFEALSVVAAVGPGVAGVQVGDPVVSMSYGAFAEWAAVPAKFLLPVPSADPKYLALLVSGLTASIALEQLGRLKKGEKVLVTAAAGGTGQFAVQLCKLAGCHVIATCSSEDKARLLRRLGADRIVDYKRESLKSVLKQEYPGGIDVVWESVGGEMFDLAVKALAPRGRLLIIGMMSQYKDGWPLSSHPGLAERLLERSASVCGFFLFSYPHLWRSHFYKLVQLEAQGKLQVALDRSVFVGLPSVYPAVEHLQSGRSQGKVVVTIAADCPAAAAVTARVSKL